MKWLLLVALFLVSCSLSEQPIVTMCAYRNTHLGISEENLLKNFGRPHKVTYRDSGVAIYEYVERFEIGQSRYNIFEIRRYYFMIEGGKVVSKHMTLYERPGYEPTGNT